MRQLLKRITPPAIRRRAAVARDAVRTRSAMAELAEARKGAGGEKLVTYLASDGLTNRLKAHLAAARLAEDTGRRFAPYWTRNEACFAAIGDVLAIDDTAWTYDTAFVVGYDAVKDAPAWTPEGGPERREDALVLDLTWQHGRMVDLVARLGGPESANDLIDRHLPWRAEVLERADAITADWRGPMIGVQIRRGDFVRFEQAVPLERYVDATRRALDETPGAGIYLASDADPEELAPFTDAFPGEVRFAPGGARESTEGVRNAASDVLALSRCDRLLLTPKSGFGRFAALIGGAPYEWVVANAPEI